MASLVEVWNAGGVAAAKITKQSLVDEIVALRETMAAADIQAQKVIDKLGETHGQEIAKLEARIEALTKKSKK